MVVAAAAVVPADKPAGSPLLGLLQELLPQHFPSATAAKRAIRRRLVLRVPSRELGAAAAAPAATADPSGVAADQAAVAAGGGTAGERPHPAGLLVLSTGCTADPGDALQLLSRCGTGTMEWFADSRGGGGAAATAAAADPRVGVGAAAGRGEGFAGASCEGGTAAAAAAAAAAATAAAAAALPGLPVAYEDEHLAVIIKPPGIDTQGSGPGSVQGRLKYCLKPTPLVGALNRPQQVHRLDAPTGGLVLAAKTHVARRGLMADLAARRISKRYCSVVKGLRAGSGLIDMPLSGKRCLTSFAPLPLPAGLLGADRPAAAAAAAGHYGEADAVEVPPGSASAAPARAHPTNGQGALPGAGTGGAAAPHVLSPSLGPLTKVALWPHTGRTHQLRKHMAYTGTPMLGDPRYRGPRPAGPADPRVSGAGPAGLLGEGDRGGDGQSCDADAVGVTSESRDAASSGDDTDAGSGGEEEAEEAGPGAEAGWEEAVSEWEVHRPPVDAGWALAAAAAAAAPGSGCAGDVLSDGDPVPLCLWAVGLRFRHPVGGRHIEVDISGWADAVFDPILQREADVTAAAGPGGVGGP